MAALTCRTVACEPLTKRRDTRLSPGAGRRDVLVALDEADLIPRPHLRGRDDCGRSEEEKHQYTYGAIHDDPPSGDPCRWPVCRFTGHAGLGLPLTSLLPA